jgi:hypothetical protein
MHTRRSFLAALAAFVGAGKIVSSLGAGSEKVDPFATDSADFFVLPEEYWRSMSELVDGEWRGVTSLPEYDGYEARPSSPTLRLVDGRWVF